MKEISMHILDIAMNSIRANANLIEICIEDSIKNNWVKIFIKDNGIGMSDEMTRAVVDPFFTTRDTRKVGLGIPLIKEACERCNGYFNIKSSLGLGTTVECLFERNNIDRAPLGNLADTIITIINCLEDCELIYNHITDEGTFTLSTSQVREMLDIVDIKSNIILVWLKEYIAESISRISKN